MLSMRPDVQPDCALFPPVIALVGPTGVGKSALAAALARRYGAAIVTADSRQVYRYMDIGTAKPTAAERAEVPHYMLDLIAPDDTYSAQRYASEGTAVLRALVAMRRPAIVTGGTGFYVRALLDRPKYPSVSPDPAKRAVWSRIARERGAQTLHAMLAETDPGSANRIHPNNVARVIRALEIAEALGRVPDTQSPDPIPALHLGLTSDRALLWERTDRRVHEQMRAGLLEETQTLLAMGYDPNSGPLAGFGYRQMVTHLRGDLTREQAIEQYQTATRQYIRRQETWFRGDDRITWIDIREAPVRRATALIDRWLAGRS